MIPSSRISLGPQCAYLLGVTLQVKGTMDSGQAVDGKIAEGVLDAATVKGQRCSGFGTPGPDGKPARTAALLGFTADGKLLSVRVTLPASVLPDGQSPPAGKDYGTIAGADPIVTIRVPGPGRFEAIGRETFVAQPGGQVVFNGDGMSARLAADLTAQGGQQDKIHLEGTWRCG